MLLIAALGDFFAVKLWGWWYWCEAWKSLITENRLYMNGFWDMGWLLISLFFYGCLWGLWYVLRNFPYLALTAWCGKYACGNSDFLFFSISDNRECTIGIAIYSMLIHTFVVNKKRATRQKTRSSFQAIKWILKCLCHSTCVFYVVLSTHRDKS